MGVYEELKLFYHYYYYVSSVLFLAYL